MTDVFDTDRVVLAEAADFWLSDLLVRPSTRQVEVRGSARTLEPRIMQVLVALAHKRGMVLSRDYLGRSCWDGRVVGEAALNRCISAIRKLGEASDAFTVDTIPRVGYRMNVANAAETAAPATADPMSKPNLPAQAQEAAASAGADLEAESLKAVSFSSKLFSFLADAPLRRAFLIVAASAVAVAVVVVGALVVGTQKRPLQNDLIAFFGFTTDEANPLAVDVAKTATDESFKAMSALRLETASRARTIGVPLNEQLKRATELGARFALGGEVRSEGGAYVVSIRLDDANSEKTLWNDTLNGVAADNLSLPAQAAAKATFMVQCFVEAKLESEPVSDKLLGLTARACASFYDPKPQQTLSLHREFVSARPKSSAAWAKLALLLQLQMYWSPPLDRSALLKESEGAAEQALSLDSTNGVAKTMLARAAIAHDGPLSDSETILVMGLKDTSSDPTLNLGYAEFLRNVGLSQQALRYAARSAEGDPIGWYAQELQAPLLASTGRRLEAEQAFGRLYARRPSATGWLNWIAVSMFENVGDVENVLSLSPPGVSEDDIACWRNLVAASSNKGNTSADARRPIQCEDNERLIATLAATGRVDRAFDVARGVISRTNPGPFLAYGWAIFAPEARPLRTDPRFLPLVKSVGIFQYWVESNTVPDFCRLTEEAKFEVCIALLRGELTHVEGLDGDWEGSVDFPTPIRQMVHIRTGRLGTSAMVDLPERGQASIPVRGLKREGAIVTFASPLALGLFAGQLSADGKTITGAWTQPSRSGPVLLTRK